MWLNRQLIYTDAVFLPVGYRLPAVYDFVANPHKYSEWDIAGAKLAARTHNLKLNGERSHTLLTMIFSIDGSLRVINKLWTTDVQPVTSPIVPASESNSVTTKFATSMF
jgi:hypothetical protein